MRGSLADRQERPDLIGPGRRGRELPLMVAGIGNTQSLGPLDTNQR
jgi:hypothetical protein